MKVGMPTGRVPDLRFEETPDAGCSVGAAIERQRLDGRDSH